MSRVNVFDCGAKGDGVTDDTAAIQAAIDQVIAAGGGTVFFPYTQAGYILARPAVMESGGRPAKSQLYIDVKDKFDVNLCLEGEMPVRTGYLYSYTKTSAPNFRLSPMERGNTRLISTWEAPEQTEPAPRPYSLLSVVEGHICAGKFSIGLVALKNLEFRGHLNPDKMYPTGSCVNLQNTSRCIVQDCFFGLNRNVGDVETGHELQANPCYTAALIMSGDQSDDQVMRNVAAQGYKYGLVLGEHVVADYLIVWNCEEAIVFHDASHLSNIRHINAQNDRIILSAFRQKTFGLRDSHAIYVRIDTIDFETNHGEKPTAYNMRYGVYDPDNRIHGGYFKWHCGFPVDEDFFPVEGAAHVSLSKF